MKFENFNDLVTQINNDLGEFCNDFQYKRKELTGARKTAENNRLFGNIKDNWAINKGGGVEVQYHVNFNKDKLRINYGLAFSTQYVPFATNKIPPQELLAPYMKAFIQNLEQIKLELLDYDFIEGSMELMKQPQYDKFCLFGKFIPVSNLDKIYFIDDVQYQIFLNDLKNQFEPYVEIFMGRNEILIRKDKDNMHSELLKYKKQIILQGPPGTGKTYTAKDIAYNMIYDNNVSSVPDERKEQIKELEKTDQYKLIQFHPAYTYEDFVRGITAKANGAGIEYITENRVLADFAMVALNNFLNSKKDKDILAKQKKTEYIFNKFKEDIENQIEEGEKYSLNKTVCVTAVEEDAFRYTGDNWQQSFRMKYSDLILMLVENVEERKFIKDLDGISGQAKHHATYYYQAYLKFKAFVEKNDPVAEISEDQLTEPQKNYVLVIDEMNRANLPAVLGELIYALEYRGEPVESMYELEGSRKLILPPNLYIIGTMNTADRSVGHIDYAIRRRFAFVDLLPESSVVEEYGGEAALKLFNEVSSLFIIGDNKKRSEYLSPEFNPEDVMIGHSYFLENKVEDLQMRLKYEIKPILKEYMKDGILLENAKEIINNLHV